MKNINKCIAEIIADYFLNVMKAEYALKKDFYSDIYLNVMNNNEEQALKLTGQRNTFMRKAHNYAHISVMPHSAPDQNGYKYFCERKWYYVTVVQSDSKMQLRKELIDVWLKNNAKDQILAVCKSGSIWDINMQGLIGAVIKNQFRISQAQNDDFLFEFDLKDFSGMHLVSEYITTKEVQQAATYLMDAWKFMGHIQYGKYRGGEKAREIKIISYDVNTGAKRKSINFKSIKQAYDYLCEAGFNMSYKTFQRRTTKLSLIKTPQFIFYATDKIDFSGPEIALV